MATLHMLGMRALRSLVTGSNPPCSNTLGAGSQPSFKVPEVTHTLQHSLCWWLVFGGGGRSPLTVSSDTSSSSPPTLQKSVSGLALSDKQAAQDTSWPRFTRAEGGSQHLGNFSLFSSASCHWLTFKLLKLSICQINPPLPAFDIMLLRQLPGRPCPIQPPRSRRGPPCPRPPDPPYQQENMWLPRRVLVSNGRSAFLTQLFKACKKHLCSSSSICSARKTRRPHPSGGMQRPAQQQPPSPPSSEGACCLAPKRLDSPEYGASAEG